MKKRIRFWISTLSLFCIIPSCEESRNSDPSFSNQQENETIKELSSLINASTILALNKKDLIHTTRGGAHISGIGYGNSDTLLYVYNKPHGGWIIYSSDPRVPPVVAESDFGTYEELIKNKNAMEWLRWAAEDMGLIRRLKDNELSMSPEEIENNINFWLSISRPDSILKSRGDGGGQGPLIGNGAGHYEYAYSYETTEVYDSIPRLTKTDWNQVYPYNRYCPYKSTSQTDTNRALAGCVAIAGAQMLYFLHNKTGNPRTAPSKAYCHGKVGDKDYNWNQYDFSSEVWDNMENDGSAAAPLIAHIGRLVNMNYTDKGSGARTEDLTNKAFPEYGISSKFLSYNTDILKSTLLSGFPAIMRATNLSQEGHAFIVDRYKRIRIKHTSVYQWIYDYQGPPIIMPYKKDSIVYGYNSPEISMIGMNWGYGEYYNKGWYSLTGDWILKEDNWTKDRKMIIINQ